VEIPTSHLVTTGGVSLGFEGRVVLIVIIVAIVEEPTESKD
jgi:hypothetical protein